MLLISSAPAYWEGDEVGAVVTLRDRTELQAVTGELDVVRGLTESLRAQNHEAANRLHTVVSLIEMGRSEQAVDFATEELRVAQELADQVVGAVQEPVLAALLLGKTAEAAERGIDLVVDGEVVAEELTVRPRELVTVLGNLVDNAMDAVAEQPERRIVVHVEGDAEGVTVVVEDSGTGVRPEDARARARARLVDQGQRRSRASASPSSARSRASTAARSRSTASDLGGARFTVTLPGAPRRGDPVTPTSACSSWRTRSWPRRRTPSTSRRVDGFELAGVARSAAEALRHLAEDPAVDLVLLDMHLPDGHGLALLQRLRAAGHPCDVIAVTSARDTEVVRRAVTQGVVLYLLKPFSFAMFRSKLEHYAAYRAPARRASTTTSCRTRSTRSSAPCAAARAPPSCPRASVPRRCARSPRCCATPTLGGPVGDRGRRRGRRLAGHRAALPRAPRRPGPGRPLAPLRRRRPPRGGLPLAPLIGLGLSRGRGPGRAGACRAARRWRPWCGRPRRRPRTYDAFDGPPALVVPASVLLRTSTMSSATVSNSSWPKPRVVSAGVPRRMPEVYQAPLGSAGIELRLVTTPASSSADSAWRPVRPKPDTSSSTRWLSVPPVTRRASRLRKPSASDWALSAICWA